jgi:hypothetical protein
MIRGGDGRSPADTPHRAQEFTEAVDREARGLIEGRHQERGRHVRPVVLDVEYMGHVRDPWGNERAAFSATATINREDWGVTNNMAFDSGRLLVSKRIQLEIELELIRQ